MSPSFRRLRFLWLNKSWNACWECSKELRILSSNGRRNLVARALRMIQPICARTEDPELLELLDDVERQLDKQKDAKN